MIVSTYSRTQGTLSSPNVYRSMTSSRQKRPYVRANFRKNWASPALYMPALGYHAIAARNNAYNLTDPNNPGESANAVRASAYARLMGKALPRAAMMVNMAQGVQSWEMVAARSFQLVRAFRCLKSGNLSCFARELSLNPNAVKRRITKKRAMKDPSGAWLEYTFGWSPLISDIYNAIDVLQSAFPTTPIRGSATERQDLSGSGSWNRRWVIHRTMQARLVADLRVTNPNLLLANQLGLLNPAAVVWDIIPFSFVVDWFLPVSAFIKTFNDQAGLQLLGQCTTLKYQVMNNEFDLVWSGEHYATSCYRLIGDFVKPGFPTKVKLPTGSMWLAATSVALVIQVFSGK